MLNLRSSNSISFSDVIMSVLKPEIQVESSLSTHVKKTRSYNLEHPHPPGKMRWIWSLQIAESSGLPSGWYAEPQSWPIKKPLSSCWQVKAESELRVISTVKLRVSRK